MCYILKPHMVLSQLGLVCKDVSECITSSVGSTSRALLRQLGSAGAAYAAALNLQDTRVYMQSFVRYTVPLSMWCPTKLM